MGDAVSLSSGPAKSGALFRPSSASRWLVCHGSVKLCADIDDSAGSEAARDGTAVHLLAEKALRNEQEPIEWLDRTLKVDGYDVHVDEAKVEGAEMYVDYVRSLVARGGELEIEARLSLEPLDPADPLMGECRGSSDAVVTWPQHGVLEVDDLKFGRGYMVPANAEQPRLYGLMAMLRHPTVTWREIRTTIVQPRDPNEAERIRTHSYDPADVWDFAGEVYAAMAAATQPNAPLVPGPGQCQWCPAKGKCPALAANALSVASRAFVASPLLHSGSPLPAPGPAPTLANPGDATDEELAVWLDRRDMVETWFKGVEEVASRRMIAGRQIRGRKMVQRTGNRKFRDPDAAPAELRKLGVKTSGMYSDPKLLSPAKIEKLVPKEHRAAFDALVDRANNGLAMVPADNKKPAALGVFGPVVTLEA